MRKLQDADEWDGSKRLDYEIYPKKNVIKLLKFKN